jgi:uncharacterized protein (DUF433 family)
MEHPRIERDPSVLAGKPVIRGTRISVDLILREVAAGLSFADIVEAYPRVTQEDLQAALAFAADFVAAEGLVSV